MAAPSGRTAPASTMVVRPVASTKLDDWTVEDSVAPPATMRAATPATRESDQSPGAVNVVPLTRTRSSSDVEGSSTMATGRSKLADEMTAPDGRTLASRVKKVRSRTAS